MFSNLKGNIMRSNLNYFSWDNLINSVISVCEVCILGLRIEQYCLMCYIVNVYVNHISM